MTNPTPHGQVPEALLHASYLESIFVSEEMSSSRASRIAKELRRLHAYCQELEAQVIGDCMTHVQTPAEMNTSQQPAPAEATEEVENLRKALVYVAFALHDTPQYMLAQGIALIDGDTVRVSRDGWTVEASVNPHRQLSPTAQAADSVPAPVQSGLVATMLDALRHAQKVLNHNNLHMECGPVNAAILAACAPADSVLEDAARLERERICAAIKAEDDYCVDHGDYMLDSDDCIKIVRGDWVRPDFSVDAARKQGANHDNS